VLGIAAHFFLVRLSDRNAAWEVPGSTPEEEGTYQGDVPEPTLEQLAGSEGSQGEGEGKGEGEGDESSSSADGGGGESEAAELDATEVAYSDASESSSTVGGSGGGDSGGSGGSGGGGSGSGGDSGGGDSSGVFAVPQSVCPGKPSKKSLSSGAPKVGRC